jgi:hypothetical protein
MGEMSRWQPGDAVLWRTIIDSRVRWALPHLLAGDDDELTSLYLPPRTRSRRPHRNLRLNNWEEL